MRWFHSRPHRRQISLLVPFRADKRAPERAAIWEWLREYWEHELPGAEIVIGHSRRKPFSKTRAVNNAARRARGDIFVILDSDAYYSGAAIRECARRIREAQERGLRLWYIPYRHLYRLTQPASARVLASDPRRPLRVAHPPPEEDVESTFSSGHGHHFGAMIQIMPREAFETVGGMESRMAGWGGEDVSFVRALDTLYQSHKTRDEDVSHLWHPKIGLTFKTRQWAGQASPRVNEQLAQRYHLATGDRVRMRALVDEGLRRPLVDLRFGWFSLLLLGLVVVSFGVVAR